MISKSGPTRSGMPQVQSIIITAITLFAFSGLMVGFTVGALVHSNKPSTNNLNQTGLIHTTPTPTLPPTATAVPFIHLGCPEFTLSNPTTNPDGTLGFSATIQAKDKNGGNCNIAQENSITADGITSRIWLVPQGDDPQTDPGTHFIDSAADQLQHPEKFNQPFPEEIPNALVFNPTTTTEAQTSIQGAAQWKFTTSPSLPKGKYYLIGLTDWQGKSYNWTWIGIAIGKLDTPTP